MKNNTLVNSFRVFIPLVFAITFFVGAALGQHVFDFEEDISISIAFIAFEHKVTELELRGIFGILALSSLVWAYLRDYSSFFPQLLQVKASFDDEGIERLLKKYDSDSRFNFEIYANWKTLKREYFRDMEKEVLEKVSKVVVLDQGGLVTANGSVKFVVEKQSIFNQSYRVVEGDGQFQILDATTNQDFTTIFRLKDTKHARIEVSLFDMVFRHSFLATPLFSQTYRFDPFNEVHYCDVLACTKARFFPMVAIGQSLYLIKGKKKWYPMGYCSYDY